MYRVTFKGDMEDILLTDDEAEQLMAALKGDRKSLVSIGVNLIDGSAVKGIISTRDEFGEAQVSSEDMDDLEQKLEAFKGNRRIDGYYASPFDQFLFSIHARGIREGRLVCFDPVEDHRWTKIHMALEYRETMRHDERLRNDASFAAKHKERMTEWFAKLKGVKESKAMDA